MPRFLRWLPALSAAAALSLAHLSAAAQPATYKIRVGVQPVMISSLWNAQAQGLFKKNGLDVELMSFTTGPAQTAALKGGVIDVAWGAATTFYAIRSAGAPVQWVGTIGDFNGNDAFVSGPKSGIRSAADLKGKKIALPFYTVVHAPLLSWLKANGLSESDVELVNLAPPQAAAAVMNGTVDAMYAWPPFSSEVVARGGKMLAHPKDSPGGGWSWVGFAANQDWAEKNAATLGRFFKALDEGREKLAENRKAIVQTAVKVTGMPVSTAEETFDLVVFPPLRNNVTPGNPMSMCGAAKAQGIAATLAQARDFYLKAGQMTKADSYDAYLNPKGLSAAFDVRCP